MRISDWSSDVCSSDLRAAAASRFHALGLSPRAGGGVAEIAGAEEGVELLRDAGEIGGHAAADAFGHAGIDGGDEAHRDRPEQQRIHDIEEAWAGAAGPGVEARSEEHTSELQSLMRNSY